MGEMRDSDWSRRNLLRSDWLLPRVALYTTFFHLSFALFFFCAIVDLSQCEMETSFSGLLVLLRLLDVFRGAPLLVLELPEKI